MSDAGCAQAPGAFIPVIDRNRCEGKGPCVSACPYGVLAIGQLPNAQRGSLNWIGRLKAWAHGGRQAFAIEPDSCRACGACVQVCPERAISLARRGAKSESIPNAKPFFINRL
jgi:NAD-dependent dihydropyrimidine dehydrogenase PreA subunit